MFRFSRPGYQTFLILRSVTMSVPSATAAVEEIQRNAGSKRGPAVTELLQYIATNGVTAELSWEPVKEVLITEIMKTLTIAITVHKHQLENGVKPKSNFQQFEESSRVEELQADADYVRDQLRQLHRPPFTCQRIAEVLLQPFQYHVISASSTTPFSLPMGCSNPASLSLDDGVDIGDDDIIRRDAWGYQLQALRPTALFSTLRKLSLVMPVDSFR